MLHIPTVKLGKACASILLGSATTVFSLGTVTQVMLAAPFYAEVIPIADNRNQLPISVGDPVGYSLGGQHVVYLGSDRHIHELWFEGDVWKHTNLTLEANAPLAAGNPSGYSLGSLHVVYRGMDNHIHELWFEGKQWKHTDLTEESKAPLAAGDPVGYVLKSQHVIYLGIDGHIHEIWFGDAQWKHVDLNEAAKAPLPLGNPHGYSLGSLHVVYRGTDNHIHEIWFERDEWRYNDLTLEASAPLAAGEPLGYVLKNQHIIYRGTDNQIHELWFDAQAFKQKWRHADLTAETKAPPAAGDPSGYSLGSLHVVYRGIDNQIHELWFDTNPFNQKWRYANLTQAAKAPVAAGNPSGYVLGTQHIVYRGTDGQIHELWFENKGFNQRWKYNNLTQEAIAPLTPDGQ